MPCESAPSHASNSWLAEWTALHRATAQAWKDSEGRHTFWPCSVTVVGKAWKMERIVLHPTG